MKKALWLTVMLSAAVALAQQTVDQGAPGTQGPWPVTLGGSLNIVFDGGLSFTGGSIVTTGPDGGPVQVNVVQSIPVTVNQGTSPWACYVAMDGGQHVIADQGTSPWVVSGAVTVSGGTVQVSMDGGQRVIADQGTSPWACYVAMDGGQHVIADQGTSPWVVSGAVTVSGGTVQVSMDGGQHVIADQGTSPWACYVAMDGGQQIIVNQGTSPWVVNGTVQVFMDGGQQIIVNQGTSPWVTSVVFDGGFIGTVIVILDGGATQTQPVMCRSTALDGGSVEQNTSVGTTATQVPASPSVGRAYVNICNSAQNASTAVVKCRQDGVAPVFAAGNPGQVLLFGDCFVATAPTTTNTIQCIADAAGRNVTTYECVPL